MWWDPFEEMRRLEERMHRLFREFWGDSGRLLGRGEHALAPYERYREPYADVQETDKEVIVTAEIPGVEKGDINLKVTDDGIEISAEKSSERSYSRFYKALSLPAKVLAEKAKATYKNGVLEVKLPKAKPEKKIRIKVE